MNNFKVQLDESGLSLAHFLKKKLDFSSKKIKEIIDAGSVVINGRIEKFSNYKLATGQLVEIFLKQSYSLKDIQVLYEDDTVIIFNKPPFICSEDFAKHFPQFILMHRLDKDTTGALLFAKTNQESVHLLQAFKERLVNKTYLAIVKGQFQTPYKVTNYLGIKSQKNGQIIMEVKHDDSKKMLAITEFKPLQFSKDYSLVTCIPKTGRTHQIRVHLACLNYPILGDMAYGSQKFEVLKPNRLMLHALSLDFLSSKNRKVFVEAPLFQDFKDLLLRAGLTGHKNNI
jgi:RluA family pseudouridine synthase